MDTTSDARGEPAARAAAGAREHEPILDPPEPEVATDWNIVRSGFAELLVTDLEASRRFYVDALGLIETAASAEAVWLRGLEEAVDHSLVLRRSKRPAVSRLGFRVWRDGDLQALAAALAAQGCNTQERAAGASRGLGPSLRVEDPLGFPVEFYATMEPAARLLQRFDLHRGARPMRLDHFNLQVPEPQRGREHYRSLGFRTTELIADEEHEGRVYGVWLARKQTVHDVAFTAGGGPRVHHVAYTVADAGSLVHVCDVLGALHMERAIERGPGRHGVSNAHYLYLRDPDGHRIELYTGDYFTGDPDLRPLRWSAHDPRRRSFWGHAVARSWYEESSLVVDLQGALQEITPLPSPERALAEQLVVG